MKQQFFNQLDFNILIIEIQHMQDSTQSPPIIKYINDAALRLLGYQRHELENIAIDRIAAAGRPNTFWQTTISQWRKQPQDNTFEVRLLCKQGQTIAVLLSYSSLGKQSPNADQVAVVIQRLKVSKQSHKTLPLMLTAVEQSASAVVITNPEGCIEYVNPKFKELTGYSDQELIGRTPKILHSGVTSPELYQALWEMLDVKGEWRGEIKNRKKKRGNLLGL